MRKIALVLIAAFWLGCAILTDRSTPTQGPIAAKAKRGDQEVTNEWAKACLFGDGKPVEVAYQNAPHGASVSFTTTGGDPHALRQHVLKLARLHNSYKEQPDSHSLLHLPHIAQFKEIDGGAQLTLVAEAPNDSDALRRHVQQDVLGMQRDGCQAAHEVL